MGLGRFRLVGDCAAALAAEDPARAAAIFGAATITYAELAARVEDCARALLMQDVVKGDRVAILSTPRPEFLVVLLACFRVGAIVVGLNPVHQAEECRVVLAECAPKLLFAFRRLRERDKAPIVALLQSAIPSIAATIDLDPDGESPFGISYSKFIAAGRATTAERLASAVAAVGPEDVALIVNTSGSTGRPKGAMITHANLVSSAGTQLALFAPAPLRTLCNLPINHTACTCDVLSYALLGGGTIVFQEHFDPRNVLAAIEEHRLTFLLQVTAMYHAILAAQARRPRDLSSLQFVFFLGAPLPRAMIAALQTWKACVVTGWGLTESTASVTYTDPGDDLDTLARSVGRAAPGFQLRVVDSAGNDLPRGETGEVLVRGDCVMPGYFNNPEATALALRADGWLRTGDLGRLDEAGRLFLTGRIKEMFKSGGYNVFPREVETVLEAHPAVEVAIVVAVPDDLYFEVGFAFVVAGADAILSEAALVAFCRERLANYKIPKGFHLCATLPMLEIGKIDKVTLREEALRLRAARAQ